MDEFLYFDGLSVLALVAVLLLMAIWGFVIVGLDHWVWARRSDLPPEGFFKWRQTPRERK
jgi:hypothetical protein